MTRSQRKEGMGEEGEEGVGESSAKKKEAKQKEEIAPIHTGFTYACWPDCEPFNKTAKKTFIKYPKYCVYFLAVSWWLASFFFLPPNTDDTERTERKASYLGYGPNRGILLQAGSIGGIN